MRKRNKYIKTADRKGVIELFAFMAFLFILTVCGMTSAIPDGKQLYTGMEPAKYSNCKESQCFNDVREELDLVLAIKLNAAWLSSPSVCSPSPIGLWIWNAFSQGTIGLSRWLVRAFDSSPVLTSSTAPDLRVTAGENLLCRRDYFRGKISYEKLTQSNLKKM